MITLLIVDDHPVVRDGLRGMFTGDPDFEVLGEAANGGKAVVPAIEAGATGYLLKDSQQEELFRAVRAAARGEAVLSPSVATRLLGQVRAPVREPLSQREIEVLGMIARGATNREAAAKLFISEATVKSHLLHIYGKLGVNDRAAAVAVAFEQGLLIPGGRK